MKRYILLFLFVAVTLMSCDPWEDMAHHSGRWYLKNNTDRTLDISSSYTRSYTREGCLVRYYANRKNIVPGDSALIYTAAFVLSCKRIPDWEDFSMVDSVFVKEGNAELCRWLRDEPVEGQRNIFDESSWRFYKEVSGDGKYAKQKLTWVFDLTEDDLKNSSTADVQLRKD